MSSKNYIPQGNLNEIAKNWLLLAILALSAAGIYSLPPVILRGPYFADKLPVELIFATSLVVHVDLSVVVWFLSIGGFFWSLIADEKYSYFLKGAFYTAAIGALTIIISPFIGDPAPLKNNYVPMLQNFAFVLGLSLFACGITIQSGLTLLSYKKAAQSPFNLGIYVSACITAIAAICFIIAYNLTPLPASGDEQSYYEALFWGGGHVLQFTFTSLMLMAWLWLQEASGLNNKLSPKTLSFLLLLNLIFTLPSPLFYAGDNSVYYFSEQMKYFAGVSALFIGLMIIWSFLSQKTTKETPHAIKAVLVLSILLFGYGGFLGYMISGVNVSIPAHYHGSIVAVTLSFMGICYYLLPQFGYGKIKGRIATLQPYIYGFGQVMHITGLAWMGGYGALRKTALSSHTVGTVGGKLLFFSGGALAITGGLLFVVVVARSILAKKP